MSLKKTRLMKDYKVLERFPHYEIYKDGRVIRRRHVLKQRLPRRVVKSWLTKNGYIGIALRDKDGVIHHLYLHRVLWEAFNGEIPEGMEIDHTDGNRTNYQLENLRLVSHSENCRNPNSLERYRAANALDKGKMDRDKMNEGRRKSDEEVCEVYRELAKSGHVGVWRMIKEGHTSYERAKRIVKMMEGKGDA